MSELTTHWRPLPQIRTKALAVVCVQDHILVCAIPDDSGAVKGWRPLGGSVEFGERAEDTVVRELNEEIAATAQVTGLRGVLQNIYTHEGQMGHEIAFIYDVTLTDPGLAAAQEFVVEDSGSRFACAWVALDRFRSGQETLFPDGLLGLL